MSFLFKLLVLLILIKDKLLYLFKLFSNINKFFSFNIILLIYWLHFMHLSFVSKLCNSPVIQYINDKFFKLINLSLFKYSSWIFFDFIFKLLFFNNSL